MGAALLSALGIELEITLAAMPIFKALKVKHMVSSFCERNSACSVYSVFSVDWNSFKSAH